MHNKVRTSKKCFLRWFFLNGTNILVIHDAPHWWYMILATYHVQCWNGRSKPYRPRFVLYQHSSLQRFLATKIMQHCKKKWHFLTVKKTQQPHCKKKWHSFTTKKTKHSSLQRKYDILSLQRKHDIPCVARETTWRTFFSTETLHKEFAELNSRIIKGW
jgi:hypothetical protein